jgi:prepilin-type N-terminal cleavage/methylation domain-containing protein
MERTSDRDHRREHGFSLIELLVVIIIIAILASIAIPTFIGKRERAHDTAAYSLVRYGLTVVQTAFVETGNYTLLTAAMLNGLDNTLKWVDNGANLVDTTPPGISAGVAADSTQGQIAFFAESPTVIDLASKSASGNWFGIQIDTVNLSESGYVKVKLIDGSANLGW